MTVTFSGIVIAVIFHFVIVKMVIFITIITASPLFSSPSEEEMRCIIKTTTVSPDTVLGLAVTVC